MVLNIFSCTYEEIALFEPNTVVRDGNLATGETEAGGPP